MTLRRCEWYQRITLVLDHITGVIQGIGVVRLSLVFQLKQRVPLTSKLKGKG